MTSFKKSDSEKQIKNKPKFFEAYNLLATWFGTGNIMFASGTFGSLMALPVWILINVFLNYYEIPPILIYSFWYCFCILLFFSGARAASLYSLKTKRSDPSSIVVDEVLGQLIALSLSYPIVYQYTKFEIELIGNLISIGHMVMAFVLFRFFDIAKPLIIGEIDRKYKGGYGVMMDDVVAGLAAGIIINIMGVFCIMIFS